jgi:hypothetical protein
MNAFQIGVQPFTGQAFQQAHCDTGRHISIADHVMKILAVNCLGSSATMNPRSSCKLPLYPAVVTYSTKIGAFGSPGPDSSNGAINREKGGAKHMNYYLK